MTTVGDQVEQEMHNLSDATLAAAKVLAAWETLPADVQASLPVGFQEAIAVMANAIAEVQAEP